jgi:hypothetical protein
METIVVQTDGIFEASRLWFEAEGVEHGKLAMFRGRQIPATFIGSRSLSILVVISVRFDATDETGLPTRAQYQEIDNFEREFIDHIEAQRLGLTAFIMTTNGTIKYFLYVSNIESISNALLGDNESGSRVELFAREDPNWDEYRAFLHGMTGLESDLV